MKKSALVGSTVPAAQMHFSRVKCCAYVTRASESRVRVGVAKNYRWGLFQDGY